MVEKFKIISSKSNKAFFLAQDSPYTLMWTLQAGHWLLMTEGICCVGWSMALAAAWQVSAVKDQRFVTLRLRKTSEQNSQNFGKVGCRVPFRKRIRIMKSDNILCIMYILYICTYIYIEHIISKHQVLISQAPFASQYRRRRQVKVPSLLVSRSCASLLCCFGQRGAPWHAEILGAVAAALLLLLLLVCMSRLTMYMFREMVLLTLVVIAFPSLMFDCTNEVHK